MKLPLAATLAAAVAGLFGATSVPSRPDASLRPSAASASRTSARAASSTSMAASKPKLPYVLLDIEAPRYSPLLPLGTMFSSSGWPIVVWRKYP